MKLYLIDGKGYWGDTYSHELPLEVEVFPPKDLAEVVVGGTLISAVEGRFTIHSLEKILTPISVDGTTCEMLVKNGNRVAAAGDSLRALLPIIAKQNGLEERIAKLEAYHKQPDFFG